MPSAENAYRQAVQRGAVGVVEPHWLEDEFGKVELAAIGTYGESLHTFNEHYARSVVNRRTVVIILSDGLDTGQTEVLDEEMERLHGRAAKLIWLNPLLGREHYEPLARGMAAALPYVDVFAPAHNLASLQQVARMLTAQG